ncbi:MAG: hypothetical protein HWN65_24410 [Candidatus Helarchaeota archaeon]|nr:hypothetical protein [Candidatus Helarchaeota archaeon]
MTQFTYGDIPDSIPSKPFFPLGEHFWRLHQELGWEYFNKKTTDADERYFPGFGEFISDKFKNSVMTAKKVLDGEIKDPENILTSWFFPPVNFVRSDLQMGSTKLIYGLSTDITFIIINDANYEVELLINGHMEDGIPFDYWYLLSDDEVFERRHMKLGWRLREIPKKTNDFNKSGKRIMDILRDVRNERTPQWSDSAYSMSMVWLSGAVNILMEPSSWGSLAEIWDGVNAKKIYGRPDHWFCYFPWPPILTTLFAMDRPSWTIRLTGLLTSHHLFINGFEPKMMNFYKNITPEIWEFVKRNLKENGVPTPRMTLGCIPPDFKSKKNFQKETFEFKYPSGTRIMPYDWGLSDEEVFGGIYTDITHETPEEPEYGKEHLIKIGIGK